MPFLDRTGELTSIIESKIQQQNYEGKPISSNNNNKKKKIQSTNSNEKKRQLAKQFYEQASQVSQDMQRTAEILQKLTKLVKKRTPFDDNVENIQHLTSMVKEHLATHEYTLRELHDKLVQQQNSASVDQSTEHSNHIVTGLNSRLMYATQQFQTILQERTKQIKQQQDRRSMFTHNKPTNFNRHLYQQQQQPMNQQNGTGELTINIQDSSAATAGGQQLQQQAQQDVVLQVYQNDQYLRARSDEVKAIAREMQHLGEMFNQMSTMVKMQGELAERIDDRITDAVMYVDDGHNELLKYFKKVASNRGLVLKMFFVMIVFIIFIGVFVIS